MTDKTKYDATLPLKSVMQEMFVANILGGMVQRLAYKAAYKHQTSSDSVVDTKASALCRNVKVKARLAYKRALAAQKCEITEESQIRRFQHLSGVAEGLGQTSAAIGAEKEISTICGLYERDNSQKQPLSFNLVKFGQDLVKPLLEAKAAELNAPECPPGAELALTDTIIPSDEDETTESKENADV